MLVICAAYILKVYLFGSLHSLNDIQHLFFVSWKYFEHYANVKYYLIFYAIIVSQSDLLWVCAGMFA